MLTFALPQAPPPEWDRFEAVELARGLVQPLELAVASDGRVFFIELGGRVAVWLPETRAVVEAGRLEVFAEQENGLLGLALDPDFARNGWIYLLHSPRDFSGQHLSRFTLVGNRLDPSSQRVLLAFEEQRVECCHHAGSLAFGPDGCLFIATGDNTNPFGDSEGYAPIDEREGREAFNALDGSASTQSLTGKILRIRPTNEGGYEIPTGNLFTDPAVGRPEIYVMGCRNPWRISVDAESGFLYWGEVGPDAGADGPRGPKGHDELNQAKCAGFFGWPMFVADNKPYRAFDHETGALGAAFDPARPINASRLNTGARELPPARPAWIFYPYDGSPEFPALDAPGGRTACAGPVYHFDAALRSETQFPAAFDDCLFVYEWSRHWIQCVRLGPAGEVRAIERFLPQHSFVRPVDLAFGPEGALYVLEYGTTWGVNEDARLVRLDYHAGNRRPVAKLSGQGTLGRAPLAASFSSAASFDPDGDTLAREWRIYPGGELVSRAAEFTHEFRTEGVFSLELVLTDPAGATTRAALPVLVGNRPPELAFDRPRHGGFFDPDHPLAFHAELTDEEDDADEAPGALVRQLARASVAARFVAGPLAGERRPDPPALARMKQSDCFHCHAREQRIVGPSLLEIAARYRSSGEDPLAVHARLVEHVRAGSSGVWGPAAMLPHPQHSRADLDEFVAWILALEPRDDSPTVVPGVSGELPPLAAEGPRSGAWVLEASYTDAGAGPVGPLAANARLCVRTFTVEAEHADTRAGTQLLDSASASGARFVGAIDHGNWLCFQEVDLAGLARVACRTSSAGAGGTLELRLDSPAGPLVASTAIVPNGAWEDWRELTLELTPSAGLHELYVVFLNEANRSALMNLDCLRFEPAAGR
jgi:cytochrome c